MSTTALDILNASFGDIGVKAQGQPLDATISQDGLSRLNRMVQGWRTQFNTITAVVRTIFPLVTNQQTYAIGLGGDFNVPRPVTITGAGLWLNGLAGASSVTSITRSGYTATVTQTSHPFAVGDEVFIAGAVQLPYNGLQTVTSVPTANTYTFLVQGTPITATGTITAAPVNSGNPIEMGRVIITDSAYQSNQIKNLSNSLFTTVYYSPTYPFGTIVLWPKPNTADNQLVLYLQNVFTGFADLHTTYDFPDVPGYAEALQYNLDLRLTIPYARPMPEGIPQLAAETLGLIKRANNKLTDLPTDASILTADRRSGYNINTGTGG